MQHNNSSIRSGNISIQAVQVETWVGERRTERQHMLKLRQRQQRKANKYQCRNLALTIDLATEWGEEVSL